MTIVVPLLTKHLEDLATFPELNGTPLVQRRVWPALMLLPGWVLIKDGHPIAAGGIWDMWPGVGEAWVAATDLAKSYPMALARGVRKTLDFVETSKKYHRLQMTVDASPELLRWATWLGFVFEGRLRQYLSNKQDRYLFAKIYGP